MDNTTAQAVAVNTTDTQSGKWNGELPGGSTPNLATLSGVANSTLGGTTNSSSLLPSVVPSNTTNTTLPTMSEVPVSVTASVSSPSASPLPVNPSVMGEVQINAAVWQQPGFLIGVACAMLGFLCIIGGLVYHFHNKRKTRRPIRGLRVVSGFDFNGGDEDDYGSFNVWDPKPPLGSAAADKSEKSGFEYDGPLTVMSNLRNSTASCYSNADEDAEFRRASSQPPPRHDGGTAL
ncbi:hypothetical protein MJO29_006230 [Puccinia striiformis f. sp. tritici]|uniref:Uncharacterized protein n=1 Tax=Puccinia striiformis f. sp. tritici PST-78 TaxID=1165861 RepID=A0A0L0VL40_9BASI|nr:hypothetical protein Pst134EA_011446 [Puccinia striiformis f. sp. tritici]KAH9467824.1 hypothetical protein Pst134EA_011446 [Puccinia striiformis f. sp. tritici]KAI7958013.1 hypothetical protein MJO29_006230 [Puccinia striiformis f. sp. tritici]KNE99946.1 hypothetical protein PSTG_06799 [Puccinia striiformis f. sp. tritici PST-78]